MAISIKIQISPNNLTVPFDGLSRLSVFRGSVKLLQMIGLMLFVDIRKLRLLAVALCISKCFPASGFDSVAEEKSQQ